MEIDFRRAESGSLERIYIAALHLAQFRGHNNVEVHLFRPDPPPSALAELRGRNLVGSPPQGMPRELIASATEDMALACLLETFTRDEAENLAAYLKERYSQQATRLVICPIDLPLPLGIGPLGALPETNSSGFLKFDLAPDYPLDFKLRGYFDLNPDS